MEKFSTSGDCTSSHLSQATNNIRVPLDTLLKDKKIHPQDNKSYFRESTVTVHRHSGQSTAVLTRENYPQHGLKHFCSKDRPPENSLTYEEHFLQKGQIKLSSSSFECQSASCASATPNILQQSMPRLIVLNKNVLNPCESCVHNQSQNLNITNNFSKDSISQGLFTDVGHFGVILAQGQAIKLHHRNPCMSKDVCQQKCVLQKAIAVVTPLTQQVIADVSFTKNPTKVQQGCLETRPVTNMDDHLPDNLHTSHPTNNESGAKSLCAYTFQTNKVQSESVFTTGLSHCENVAGPGEHKKLGQKENLSSVPLNSMGKERKEAVQPYPNCSVKSFSKDNATVMGGNSEGTETGLDHTSTIPAKEWSLQRLRILITDLEQMEKKHQKEVPFNDLTSKVLKMYWNGDPIKLCNAVRSNGYAEIMKNVGVHRGKETSVILHEVSREKLNEIASRFHILKHDLTPPKMVYTSSWLNLSGELYDIDKEDDCPAFLMTVHHNAKVTEKEVPMNEIEDKQESTDKKIQALSGGEKESKPLPPKHQQNLSVKGEKRERNEPVGVNDEVRKGENSLALKNLNMQRTQSEKHKARSVNEASLLVSSSPQLSDVRDSCVKPGNSLKLPSTDMTPALDKNSIENCTLLSPEITGKLDEKVDNMQKEDEQISTNIKGQVTVELFDQDKKHTVPEIKPDKMSSRIKINWQVENYCCFPKWFQALGYRNRGLCKCEQKVEPSHHADTLGKGVQNVNVDKHTHPSNKTCTLNHTDICELRDNKQAKARLRYRNMMGKKSVGSSVNDASMDEIRIVDVITDYKDVFKLANAMSEQLMVTPVVAHTSTDRKHHTNHKQITTPEDKTRDSLINLMLFGTSHLSQRKSSSGLTSSDKVQLPPERINVIINSGGDVHPNNTESQTPRQQVWNSWKKAFVPLSTKIKSMKQKTKQAPETKNMRVRPEAKCKNTPADKKKNTCRTGSKKKSLKNNSSTRMDKIRNLNLSKTLVSFDLNKRLNNAKHRLKPTKSSIEQAQAVDTSKNKLNAVSALNFGVLPESFSISGSSSSMEAKQSAAADWGSKSKAVIGVKRSWDVPGNWCDSPRKKQCKSTLTLPRASGSSTFQEFKKKYDAKKQRVPT